MLRIYSKKAKIGIHESLEFESIVSRLKLLGYDPVIRNMISESYQTAKLTPPSQLTLSKIMTSASRRVREFSPRNDAGGEIFFKDDLLFAVFPEYDNTVVSLIGFEQESNHLDQFCGDFQKAVEYTFDGRRMKGTKFDWIETDEPPRMYDYIHDSDFRNFYYRENIGDDQKFEKPSYTIDDYTSSKLLCNEKLRSFLIKISKLGKILEDDVKSELDESQIQILIDHNLLSKEFLIRCTNDARTICTVTSLDNLTENSNDGAKCAYCRRPLSEENTVEIFTISNKGRNLMAGSKWMSIWVTEELIRHGIKSDSIDWRIEDKGEEIDIRISDFNSKVLLELKDREFGGGDAHPFIYRVDKYRGNIGGILTTKKIAKEAKTIIREQESKMSCTFVTYEGIDRIEHGIQKMVVDMSLIQINRQLRMFSTMYGSITPMVDSWANRKISNSPPLEISSSINKSQSELEQLKNKPSLDN